MSRNHSFKHLSFLSSPVRLGLVLVLLMATLGILPAPVARAADITVTNTNDSGAGSLRQAIADATAGDEILLAVTGTITLGSELSIDKNLTIKGPGADQLAISGGDSVRVLNISGGTVVISGVTIADGSVTNTQGAGILVSNAANVTLRYCAVTNNATIDDFDETVSGGGIHFNSTGTLTLEYCEISNNTADFGYGGGLNVVDGSSITITGCTFSGNTGYEGGGIYTAVDLTINGSTIASNEATDSGGGGVAVTTPGTVTVRNTIIADNIETSTAVGPDIWDDFGDGSFSSGGYNIVEDVGSATFTTTTGDVTGSDPGLGALALNNGQTRSHSITDTSDAYNAIPSASSYNGAPTTDQRGFGRNGNYDIGAYEASAIQPEANIQGNSQNIADGDSVPDLADHTDFGSVLTSSGTQDRIFTIQNTGSATMTILSVWITGTHSSDFSVTAAPSTVAASDSSTFTVQFDPSADGVRSATIHVSCNDADEHPYDFAVQGTGAVPAPPELAAFSPARNTVAAPLDSTVVLTYSHAMSATTVTSQTVAVHSMMQGLITATHSVDDNVVTVTPSRPFFPGELVYAIATTQTADITGTHPLTATLWQFNAGEITNRCVEGFDDISAALTGVEQGSVAWGDYDGDGDLDILLTGDTGST